MMIQNTFSKLALHCLNCRNKAHWKTDCCFSLGIKLKL